ncbi:hypothetical protein HDE_04469 [Halotydeus destructor]|nr:hypothetical protein HDE_04469 [Halotydeus destructor]
MENKLSQLKEDVHRKKEAGSHGIDTYMKSLEAQSELLQEQSKVEQAKVQCEQKIDEIKDQRRLMAAETERIEKDALRNLGQAKDQARNLMETAKVDVQTAKPGILDRIAQKITGEPPEVRTDVREVRRELPTEGDARMESRQIEHDEKHVS